MLFIDVRMAHLVAKCDDTLAFIDLSGEDAEEGMCGKLSNWIYCMRGAAHGWEFEYRFKFSLAIIILLCFVMGLKVYCVSHRATILHSRARKRTLSGLLI